MTIGSSSLQDFLYELYESLIEKRKDESEKQMRKTFLALVAFEIVDERKPVSMGWFLANLYQVKIWWWHDQSIFLESIEFLESLNKMEFDQYSLDIQFKKASGKKALPADRSFDK